MGVTLDMPILVVDDMKTMTGILQNLLKSLGFTNVQEAASGEEALKRVKERKFGLVVSDWYMQPMSGLELITAMKADENLKSVRFIMMTADPKTENVVLAKRAGVDNYMVKPFTAQTLKQKIAAAFGEG